MWHQRPNGLDQHLKPFPPYIDPFSSNPERSPGPIDTAGFWPTDADGDTTHPYPQDVQNDNGTGATAAIPTSSGSSSSSVPTSSPTSPSTSAADMPKVRPDDLSCEAYRYWRSRCRARTWPEGREWTLGLPSREDESRLGIVKTAWAGETKTDRLAGKVLRMLSPLVPGLLKARRVWWNDRVRIAEDDNMWTWLDEAADRGRDNFDWFGDDETFGARAGREGDSDGDGDDGDDEDEDDDGEDEDEDSDDEDEDSEDEDEDSGDEDEDSEDEDEDSEDEDEDSGDEDEDSEDEDEDSEDEDEDSEDEDEDSEDEDEDSEDEDEDSEDEDEDSEDEDEDSEDEDRASDDEDSDDDESEDEESEDEDEEDEESEDEEEEDEEDSSEADDEESEQGATESRWELLRPGTQHPLTIWGVERPLVWMATHYDDPAEDSRAEDVEDVHNILGFLGL